MARKAQATRKAALPVFVDTSAWYALINRRDAHHGEFSTMVRGLIAQGARLVTTDYVIDEACTLAKARAGTEMAVRLLEVLEKTMALDLEWIGQDRFAEAKKEFRKHDDQAYSFTDCTSFVVMRERRITQAITTDDHFRIAGFQLLPDPRS